MTTATKINWIVTAEHTQGKSVDHPCTKGVYSDPTDYLELTVEAADWAEAEQAGQDELKRLVDEAEPCGCRRNQSPGGESWWQSVVIKAKPEFFCDHDTHQQVIAEARDNWDEGDITDAIKERFNCREAEVDHDGDVWIADPQDGHWISDEDMTGLVMWMHARKMI